MSQDEASNAKPDVGLDTSNLVPGVGDDEPLSAAPVLDVAVDSTPFSLAFDDFSVESPTVPAPPQVDVSKPVFEVTELQDPHRLAVKTSPLADPTIIVNAFESAKADERRTGTFTADLIRLRPVIGVTRLGARFERIKPGTRTSYPHAHKSEGELTYCLSGNGVVWQNGFTYPFRSGDCASWTSGTGVVHTIINDSNRDGEEGEDMLLFSVSEMIAGDRWWYPLSAEVRARITPEQTWEERDVPQQNDFGPHPGFPCVPYGSPTGKSSDYPRPSEGPRPSNIVNVFERADDFGEGDMFAHGCCLTTETHLTGATIGCHLDVMPPGTRSSVGHAHSHEDELVFVLQGTGSLWLDGHIIEVGPGDCVGFPAGTGIAHTFINDSNADGGEGNELWLFIVGENKRFVDKVVYPANFEKEATFKRWWKDYPRHALGPHNGLPRVPRK
ncbi:hypothetical protein AURDEDRAFT_184576 [Auricularia subglabra TFB-10046 SS5]|nr:hypothetical protein AURDEDRAFT_184576 [Auricularia subglabra TFB-10046 SS5]